MADGDTSLNLPWRWENPPADKGLVVLVDSTGRTLIYGVGSEPGWARVPIPYVRAVTERAGAMEASLRQLVDEIDHNPDATYRLPSDLCDGARALLAEIDIARKGG